MQPHDAVLGVPAPAPAGVLPCGMLNTAITDSTDHVATAARARSSWEEIQAASRGAEARCRESYAAIEAAHADAAARSTESWATIEAAHREGKPEKRSFWRRIFSRK